MGRRGDPPPPVVVSQQRPGFSSQRLGVADRHCDRRHRLPVRDVPNGGADRRYSGERGFQYDDGSGLVARRHQQKVRPLDHRAELGLRQKPMEDDAVRDAERHGGALNLAVERVHPDDVEREGDPRFTQSRGRVEQRALILDPIEARDMEEPCRPVRVARPRGPHGPGPLIGAERQAHRGVAEASRVGAHGVTGGGKRRGPRQSQPHPQPAAKALPAPVADVGEGYQLTTGKVKQHGPPQEPAGAGGDHPRWGGPERMEDAECAAPMLPHDGAERPPDGVSLPDVVDGCAQESIAGRPRLLVQREYVNLVRAHQALHQPQQGRDDSVGSTAVHATRHDERDLHRPPAALPRGGVYCITAADGPASRGEAAASLRGRLTDRPARPWRIRRSSAETRRRHQDGATVGSPEE